MDIRTFRLSRDITQADLAESIGVSQAAISQWELGVTFPSGRQAATLIRFSCGKITLDDLYPKKGKGEAA